MYTHSAAAAFHKAAAIGYTLSCLQAGVRNGRREARRQAQLRASLRRARAQHEANLAARWRD